MVCVLFLILDDAQIFVGSKLITLTENIILYALTIFTSQTTIAASSFLETTIQASFDLKLKSCYIFRLTKL